MSSSQPTSVWITVVHYNAGTDCFVKVYSTKEAAEKGLQAWVKDIAEDYGLPADTRWQDVPELTEYDYDRIRLYTTTILDPQ